MISLNEEREKDMCYLIKINKERNKINGRRYERCDIAKKLEK
jgi:hypothetical protein